MNNPFHRPWALPNPQDNEEEHNPSMQDMSLATFSKIANQQPNDDRSSKSSEIGLRKTDEVWINNSKVQHNETKDTGASFEGKANLDMSSKQVESGIVSFKPVHLGVKATKAAEHDMSFGGGNAMVDDKSSHNGSTIIKGYDEHGDTKEEFYLYRSNLISKGGEDE